MLDFGFAAVVHGLLLANVNCALSSQVNFRAIHDNDFDDNRLAGLRMLSLGQTVSLEAFNFFSPLKYAYTIPQAKRHITTFSTAKENVLQPLGIQRPYKVHQTTVRHKQV